MMYSPKSYVLAMRDRWNERLTEMPEREAANVRFMAWLSLMLLVVSFGSLGIVLTLVYL